MEWRLRIICFYFERVGLNYINGESQRCGCLEGEFRVQRVGTKALYPKVKYFVLVMGVRSAFDLV